MINRMNKKSNMGWCCPMCWRVYAPDVNECYHCNSGVGQEKEEKEWEVDYEAAQDSSESKDEGLNFKIDNIKQMLLKNMDFDDLEEGEEIVLVINKDIVGKLEKDLERIIFEG